MMKIFTGLSKVDGTPLFRYEHPFFVTKGRKTANKFLMEPGVAISKRGKPVRVLNAKGCEFDFNRYNMLAARRVRRAERKANGQG